MTRLDRLGRTILRWQTRRYLWCPQHKRPRRERRANWLASKWPWSWRKR